MGVLLPHRISDAVFFIIEVLRMETRVAVMSVIVEDPDSVERLNGILHEFGQWIIGRMGIPYRKRGVSIISIALDAPQNTISSLAGKIGSLPGVSVKTAYSGVIGQE
jgi:putative iron-only hydrogenase system regulator